MIRRTIGPRRITRAMKTRSETHASNTARNMRNEVDDHMNDQSGVRKQTHTMDKKK